MENIEERYRSAEFLIEYCKKRFFNLDEDEVESTVSLALYRACLGYNESLPHTFRSYALTAMMNAARDLHRKRQCKSFQMTTGLDLAANSHYYDRQDFLLEDLIEAKITDPLDAAIVRLRYIESCTLEEITERLGVTLKIVYYRLKRSHETLKRHLQPNGL